MKNTGERTDPVKIAIVTQCQSIKFMQEHYEMKMLCYVIWLFVKRLSQEAIQRRSQRDRRVRIKFFKLRRDADDIPCNITLRSAGGESFHSAEPTTAKARFWDREVRDQGIRRSQRSAERSGREERADGALDMSSHRYFGARPCWDLATMQEQDLVSNLGQDWEPVQLIDHVVRDM